MSEQSISKEEINYNPIYKINYMVDGNIDTIVKMNQYISGMTTDLGKAIFNP